VKPVMTTVSVVLLLSTVIWAVAYRVFPSEPLKPRETALVVFVLTVVIALCQAAWGRIKNRRRK